MDQHNLQVQKLRAMGFKDDEIAKMMDGLHNGTTAPPTMTISEAQVQAEEAAVGAGVGVGVVPAPEPELPPELPPGAVHLDVPEHIVLANQAHREAKAQLAFDTAAADQAEEILVQVLADKSQAIRIGHDFGLSTEFTQQCTDYALVAVPDYHLRMLDEQSDLLDKIFRLEVFIEHKREEVSDYDHEVMSEQLQAMRTYAQLLSTRVARSQRLMALEMAKKVKDNIMQTSREQ